MKLKTTLKAEYAILEKEVREIQFLASSLDSNDPKQLETVLCDLESKITALRSFIWNHLSRKTKES